MTDREWKERIANLRVAIDEYGRQRQAWKEGVEKALSDLVTNVEAGHEAIRSILQNFENRLKALEEKSHGP